MKTPRLFEPEVPIPEDIREAVELWTSYKKEQFRFTYKPIALAALIRRMAKWGPERAAAAVEFSMAGGWEGLFEEKKSGRNKGPAPWEVPPASYAEIMTPGELDRFRYGDKNDRKFLLESVGMEAERRRARM